MRRLFTLSIALVCFLAKAESSFAIPYVRLVPGGHFYCGYLKNGQNVVVNKSRKAVAGSEAKAILKGELKRLVHKTVELRNLRLALVESEPDVGLTVKQLREVISIAKYVNSLVDTKLEIGKSKNEQIAAVDSIITQIAVQRANIEKEQLKLNDCIKNKRIVYGNVTVNPIFFNHRVIPLLLLNDNIYSVLGYRHVTEVYMCMPLKGWTTTDEQFAMRFKLNPCEQYSNGGTLNCPELVPGGQLGFLLPPTYGFIGGDPTPDVINYLFQDMLDKFGTSIEGRANMKSDDPCFANELL
jgi:hypothetical protein